VVPTIFALGVLRALLWFTRGGILPPLYSIVSLNAKVQNQRGSRAAWIGAAYILPFPSRSLRSFRYFVTAFM